MQYKPQPINPPIGYNPIDEYNRQLNNQGEPWIDGGVIDEVVVTPKSYQFDWIKKVPKELRDRLYDHLYSLDPIKSEISGVDQYSDFLDRNPEFNNKTELWNYLLDRSYQYLNPKTEQYNRLVEVWSKYPYKVDYDATYSKRPSTLRGLRYNNISGLSSFVAEIAHSYQDDFGKVSKWKVIPQQIERIFREIVYPKTDKRYDHVYKTPGYVEHETHGIIQPQLVDYIFNGTPVKFINQNNK